MTDAYRFHSSGVEFVCARPIRGLRTPLAHDVPLPEAVRISFRQKSEIPKHALLFAWPGRYAMTVNACDEGILIFSAASGAALIKSNQNVVECYQCDDSEQACEDFLIRRVLPRVSILRGNMAYHAAAVGNGTTGLLLLGQSGTGKTALATAIALSAGWSVLSEDTTLLDDSFNILPGTTGSGLWEDACVGLNLPADQCRAMPLYENKFWYEPLQPASAAPQKLAAVVLLTRDRDGGTISPAFDRVPKAQALAAIASHFVRLYPGDTMEQTRLHHAAKMVEAIPVWHVTYPNGYDRLPEVAAAICRLAGP